MRMLALLVVCLCFLVGSVSAQEEPRPGVQAPGLWLISPVEPTAGAVGLACVDGMEEVYVVVFPQRAPLSGQSLVVTRTDERTHRVYLDWQTMSVPTSAAGGSVLVDVPMPVIAQNSSATIIIDVPSAAMGDAVYASPQTTLPDGLVIAYARVKEGGKVELRLANVSAGALDGAVIPFSIGIVPMVQRNIEPISH